MVAGSPRTARWGVPWPAAAARARAGALRDNPNRGATLREGGRDPTFLYSAYMMSTVSAFSADAIPHSRERGSSVRGYSAGRREWLGM
jgi:hypothetical protein